MVFLFEQVKSIFENPTFLLSDNVYREIRSLIDYDMLSSETVMWLEYFLIPILIEYKNIYDPIIKLKDKHPNLFEILKLANEISETVKLQEERSSQLKVEVEEINRKKKLTEKLLKNNLNEDQRIKVNKTLKTLKQQMYDMEKKYIQSAISDSKILERTHHKEKQVIDEFTFLDDELRKSIDDLINVENDIEFQKRKKSLETSFADNPENLSASEHDELPRLLVTNHLKFLFRKLYIKLRQQEFNIRNMVSQAELNEKMEEFMRLDEIAAAVEEQTKLEEMQNAQKAKSKKKKGKEKIKEEKSVSKNVSLPYLQQMFSKAYVRDESKLELEIEDVVIQISQLEGKIASLQRRIDLLNEDQVKDANSRVSSEDDDVRKRAISHKNLYEKIIQSMRNHKKIYEVEKEQLEDILRKKTSHSRCEELVNSLCSFYT